MRRAERLGVTVPAAAGEDCPGGGGEIDEVPHGYVDRFHAPAGPQGESDHFAAVADLPSAPGPGRRLGVLSQEAGFRAADGGTVREKADVEGEPEAAGVTDPLTVEKEEIDGARSERNRGRQYNRLIAALANDKCAVGYASVPLHERLIPILKSVVKPREILTQIDKRLRVAANGPRLRDAFVRILCRRRIVDAVRRFHRMEHQYK